MLSQLRELYNKSASRNYMSFDNWFKSHVEDMMVRDFIRLEEAWECSLDAFSMLDSIEDDELFEEKINSLHDEANALSDKMNELYIEMTEKVGKDVVNAYIRAINQ